MPPSADQQEPSTSVKRGKEKMIFDSLFQAKRPRFVDDDEEDDEQERDTKRSKHEEYGKSISIGTGSPRAGKSVTEQDVDYMSVLKIVRVNLSNLKSVSFSPSSHLVSKIVR
jgi:hypothetical protein